jgi:hypothetical protein
MNRDNEYLHYYLGCECKWRVFGEYDGEWNTSTLDLKILDRIYDRQPFEVKPVLRSLKDMTVVEFKEYESVMVSRKPFGFMHMEAAKTNWLLSKHFDLFGLIDAGLAIDATTLLNDGQGAQVSDTTEAK